MLEIHSLEVQFEVDGDDDAVFARLFAEHMLRWARRQEQQEAAHQALAQASSLVDPDGGRRW